LVPIEQAEQFNQSATSTGGTNIKALQQQSKQLTEQANALKSHYAQGPQEGS